MRAFPFVVTARHCLWGKGGNEQPVDKAIFVDRGLERIGHLPLPHVFELDLDGKTDIAAFVAPDLLRNRCLPSGVLPATAHAPRFITIFGYLGRDFRRTGVTGTLAPQPYLYSNRHCIQYVPGKRLGLRYSRHKNVAQGTGLRVTAPTPAGISGGPMLDTIELLRGRVAIVGFFTDYRTDRGVGWGEYAGTIRLLLDFAVTELAAG